MAVGASTYGTAARVQALVGDIVEARTFGTATTPTLVEVEGMLDDVAREIHATIAEAGYPIETASTLSTSYAAVHEFLRHLNSVGAAVLALDSMSGEAVAPEGGEIIQTRSQRLAARYKRLLALCRGQMIARLGLARSRSLTATMSAGAYQDDDGNVKAPFFERGMQDFPNTRSLVEE